MNITCGLYNLHFILYTVITQKINSDISKALFDKKSPVHWETEFPKMDSLQTDIETYRLNRLWVDSVKICPYLYTGHYHEQEEEVVGFDLDPPDLSEADH